MGRRDVEEDRRWREGREAGGGGGRRRRGVEGESIKREEEIKYGWRRGGRRGVKEEMRRGRVCV